MIRASWLAGFIAASGATGAIASDLNPAGFYLGAAAVKTSDVLTAVGARETDTGWKLMAGLRPLHLLGAELEYTDFGSGQFSNGYHSFNGSWSGHATGLFAVSYLPLPSPFLDIFAKIGAQRTETAAEGGVICGGGIPICNVLRAAGFNETETDFAYGAGVQAKLHSLAVRVEYERTETNIGHPKLLSFGLTLTF